MKPEEVQKVVQKWFEKNNLENRKITAEMAKVEPNTKVVCPRCKKPGLEFSRQTRSGDESQTKFFKCINYECKDFMVEKRLARVLTKNGNDTVEDS